MTAAATELHATPAPKAASRQALGTTVNIPPRRLDFEFKAEQKPRYFYGNDPFLSSFWNTFSSLLPQGEFAAFLLLCALGARLPRPHHRPDAERPGFRFHWSGSHAQQGT